jgi:hypothetical protein
MPTFLPTQRSTKALLDGRMKRKAKSKAFGEENIHIERSSVSFEELSFILQNF